jgi:hypothetical protein
MLCCTLLRSADALLTQTTHETRVATQQLPMHALTDLIQGADVWRQATMYTQHLAVNQRLSTEK